MFLKNQKCAWVFLLIFFQPLVSHSTAQETFAHNLLSLPEDQINVATIAFTLAKEIHPDIDVTAYSTKIDWLAKQVRRLAKDTKDPDQRIRCLNTVLFLHEKFQANRNSSHERNPESYFLNHLLDTKEGNCFSMPLLYVAVGQRLGWPIYLVHVPDNCFVRYVDSTFKEQNIETTSGGGYVPDEKYAKDFLVSSTGHKSGAYLRTLTYRELLGNLLELNAIIFSRQDNLPKSITYLTFATKLNPQLASAWANLATASHMMASRSSDPEANSFREAAKQYEKKLAALGFVDPQDIPQLTQSGRTQ